MDHNVNKTSKCLDKFFSKIGDLIASLKFT